MRLATESEVRVVLDEEWEQFEKSEERFERQAEMQVKSGSRLEQLWGVRKSLWQAFSACPDGDIKDFIFGLIKETGEGIVERMKAGKQIDDPRNEARPSVGSSGDRWRSSADAVQHEYIYPPTEYIREKLLRGELTPGLMQNSVPGSVGGANYVAEMIESGQQAALGLRVAGLNAATGSELHYQARSPIPGNPLDIIDAADPLGLSEMYQLSGLSEDVDTIRSQNGLPPDNEHSFSVIGMSNKVERLVSDLGVSLGSLGGGWDI